MVSLPRAIELVGKFKRHGNYPKDEDGVIDLAKALQYAERVTGVGPGRIAEKCARESEFCPTDFDLLTVAKELAREDGVAAGTYDSTAGAGNAVEKFDKAAFVKKHGNPKLFDAGVIDQEKVKAVKSRESAMFAAIKKFPSPEKIDWHWMADAAEKAGYPDYAKAWRRGIVGGGK